MQIFHAHETEWACKTRGRRKASARHVSGSRQRPTRRTRISSAGARHAREQEASFVFLICEHRRRTSCLLSGLELALLAATARTLLPRNDDGSFPAGPKRQQNRVSFSTAFFFVVVVDDEPTH
jgi:hypothetical protein